MPRRDASGLPPQGVSSDVTSAPERLLDPSYLLAIGSVVVAFSRLEMWEKRLAIDFASPYEGIGRHLIGGMRASDVRTFLITMFENEMFFDDEWTEKIISLVRYGSELHKIRNVIVHKAWYAEDGEVYCTDEMICRKAEKGARHRFSVADLNFLAVTVDRLAHRVASWTGDPMTQGATVRWAEAQFPLPSIEEVRARFA